VEIESNLKYKNKGFKKLRYLFLYISFYIMPKRKLNANIYNFPSVDLLIFADYIPFKTLRKIFMDYRLILSARDSDITHDEYMIKKDKTSIGRISLSKKKELPVTPSTSYLVSPGTVIEVERDYKDKILENIKEMFELQHKQECPNCGTEKRPLANRETIGHGRKPYSTEISYNCPDCGYQYWPRKK
jgi:uncharacterized protein with PIN domain